MSWSFSRKAGLRARLSAAVMASVSGGASIMLRARSRPCCLMPTFTTRKRRTKPPPYAARRVPNHRIDLPKKTPISYRVKVDEKSRVWSSRGKCACPFDQRVTSRVGVWINDDELFRSPCQGRKQCVGLRVRVAENGDGMPRHEDVGRVSLRSSRSSSAVRLRSSTGADGRAMAPQPGGPAKAPPPSRSRED